MRISRYLALAAAAFCAVWTCPAAHGDITISEVDPTGSAAAGYLADWFELTNTGPSAVDISGWKMDDNSNAFGSAVLLRGITSIAAGKSVVFLEGTADGSTDATLEMNFMNTWFGAQVPAGFTIGAYGGTGVGLSSSSDAVNIFDGSGSLVTRVDFGTSTSGVTFDNAAGLNNNTLTTLSAAGVRGAFTAPDGEIGSPGAVPEPGSLAMAAVGAMALGWRRRRKV